MTARVSPTADVVIIGGGIIGSIIAFELAKRGAEVTVVERGRAGGEASGAAAGIISPPSEAGTPAASAEITSRSIRDYPDLIAEVEELTGLDVGFRWRGELTVAQTDDEAAVLQQLVEAHTRAGFRSEWLDDRTAREAEPLITGDIRGGILSHEAGSLFPDRLTRAIAAAAIRHGVTLLEHTEALGITIEGDRATGVRVLDGTIPAGQVVLATGAWTARFGVELGRPLPVVPAKGQMLAITGAPQPRHIIGRYRGGHLVPRPDGTTAVGATIEYRGFDKRVTGDNIRWCLEMVGEVAPTLLGGEVVSHWTGLRPSLPGKEPVMGRVPGYDRLWVTAGHLRAGIQRAPETGKLMAAAVATGRPDPLLAAFDPAQLAQVGVEQG